MIDQFLVKQVVFRSIIKGCI